MQLLRLSLSGMGSEQCCVPCTALTLSTVWQVCEPMSRALSLVTTMHCEKSSSNNALC